MVHITYLCFYFLHVSIAGAKDQGGMVAQERRVSFVHGHILVYIGGMSCREDVERFINPLG